MATPGVNHFCAAPIVLATLPQSSAAQPAGGQRSVRVLTAWSAPPAGVLKITEER
jgi:fatty-acyl-CoA synthase